MQFLAGGYQEDHSNLTTHHRVHQCFPNAARRITTGDFNAAWRLFGPHASLASDSRPHSFFFGDDLLWQVPYSPIRYNKGDLLAW